MGDTETGTGGRRACVGHEVKVKAGEKHLEWFKVEQGVRQGCTFSPWLFNVSLDTLGRRQERASWRV